MLGQATGNLELIWFTTARTRGKPPPSPYNIICSSPPHLHPNGSFSRDSQSGVLKLSRFGLSRLWAFIIFRPHLGSRRGLNQICSSPRELSNNVLYFTCTHRNWVNSRLLVVGSQTVSLTLALLSTITCVADVQMAMWGHFGHLHFKTFPTI